MERTKATKVGETKVKEIWGWRRENRAKQRGQ